MGTIYRNGVPFVGSGGAGGVEVTEAEYELLPESEKMNGTIYFITDGDVSYPSASQMRYDNTESQIPSTTVQGAIDENRIEINSLQSGLIWQKLFDADVEQGNTGTLSDSLTNYNEFIVQYYIGGQMKTAICPASGFSNSLTFGGNEYVSASYKGSTTIRFTSATTFQVLELTTTGWTLNKRIRIFAR